MWIFSYVHLNPISIIEGKWKEGGVKNKKETGNFLETFQFSSYQDFLGENRPEGAILDWSLLPKYIKTMKLDFETQEQVIQQGLPLRT